MSKKYYNLSYASVVQWLGFLLCDQKVMGSIPGRSKGVFFFAKNINRQALCLGGHTEVRVPGSTIARKNTSCVINKLIDHTSVLCSM